MKVKTLLSTLHNVDYVLMSESGILKESGYVSKKYYGESNFEDSRVVRITTVKDCDTLYITIKN